MYFKDLRPILGLNKEIIIKDLKGNKANFLLESKMVNCFNDCKIASVHIDRMIQNSKQLLTITLYIGDGDDDGETI